MIDAPTDSLAEARDAALALLLAEPEFPGWSLPALAAVLRRHGQAEAEAARLFPGGALAMIAAFSARADRLMAARADLAGRGLTGRVRALIVARLRILRPHKEAVRRALGLLLMRRHAPAGIRLLAGSVDAIWHQAGDHAVDFSWYTKRTTLAGIYGATLLYWLTDASENDEASLAFLDRRLARLKNIGKMRACLKGAMPPAWGAASPS